MSMNPRLLKPTASGFSPRSISGLALWLDASDSSTLFQNSDGTVPATATSDPVGYWGDKSGNGRHAVQATAGSRPLVGTQNSRTALTFDGTDDNLRHTPSTALGATEVTHIAVLRNNLTAQPNLLYAPGIMTAGNVGRPIDRWQGLAFTGSVFVASTPQIDVTSPFRSLDSRFVFILDGKKDGVSAGTHQLREFINGASIYSATSTGTWATTSQRINIGTRDDGGTRYKGDICELLMYDRRLTTTERQRLERYLAARWGITLAPTVSNADAQDWIDRVYQNGGSVSSATAAAVNTFCDAIDSASIRDRFYRMGIFAGSNLNAALVPLYRGPSLGGTQYGGATDTNNAFVGVGTDYAETGASGGLTGNGTTKYLNTGFNVNNLTATSFHLSSFIMGTQSITTAKALVGALFNGVSDRYRIFLNATATPASTYSVLSELGKITNVSASLANGNAGLMLTSRTTASSLTLYDDGVSINTNPASTAEEVSATPLLVFARTGPVEYYNGTMGAYSIGAGLDATQAAAYSAAMNAFQTALGRV